MLAVIHRRVRRTTDAVTPKNKLVLVYEYNYAAEFINCRSCHTFTLCVLQHVHAVPTFSFVTEIILRFSRFRNCTTRVQ